MNIFSPYTSTRLISSTFAIFFFFSSSNRPSPSLTKTHLQFQSTILRTYTLVSPTGRKTLVKLRFSFSCRGGREEKEEEGEGERTLLLVVRELSSPSPPSPFSARNTRTLGRRRGGRAAAGGGGGGSKRGLLLQVPPEKKIMRYSRYAMLSSHV